MKGRRLNRYLHLLLLVASLFSGTHAVRGQARTDSATNGSTPEAQSPEKNKQEEDQNEAYKHSAAVAKLGHVFGMSVDQSATTFEVGNFFVLAALLAWMLGRMLPRTFRNRNTAIQKHLVDARTATEEAGARLSSVEERLSELDDRIAEMKARADHDAAAEEQRARAALEEEKRKMLESTEEEIAAATAHARRQLQRYAAELAVEQAARRLVVSVDMDRALVQAFARRLTDDPAKDGRN